MADSGYVKIPERGTVKDGLPDPEVLSGCSTSQVSLNALSSLYASLKLFHLA